MPSASVCTKNDTLVAIDCAKRFHDILIRRPKRPDQSARIPVNQEGFAYLLSILNPGECSTHVALEATADYHRTIANFLLRNSCKVHLVSSVSTHRVREAIFNSTDKNDKKDARVILYLLEQGHVQRFNDPALSCQIEWQELAGTHRQVSLAKSRLSHSPLNHYLTIYFPEFERYHCSTRAEWFARFLIRFTTPALITELKEDEFVAEAWELVGRKVGKDRVLRDIYKTAHESIGVPIPTDSPAIPPIRLQLQRYLEVNQQLKHLEARAQEMLDGRRDYQVLTSIPGIGPVLALTILAEAGDLRRFRHHRQFIKFCGFNLTTLQSGQSRSSTRISKRGNARLRYAFWLAATSAIRQKENTFQSKFSQYIRHAGDTPDNRRKARTAVAVKMVRVAHALIKTDSLYRGYQVATVSGVGT